MKNWSIIIASALIAAAIVFYALSNRFYIDTSTNIKIDRLTGQTYKLRGKSHIGQDTVFYWEEVFEEASN